MPLVPCSECGHNVSTAATNCPNCGAPVTLSLQTKRWSPWWVIGALLAAGVSLAGVITATAPAPKPAVHPQAAAPPAAPAPRQHHWATMAGNFFGYKSELSANDQQAGIAAKALILVRYRGHHGGQYEFLMTDGGPTATLMTCDDACEFVTALGPGGNRVLPVEPDSVLGAVVDDMKHGDLDLPGPTK